MLDMTLATFVEKYEVDAYMIQNSQLVEENYKVILNYVQ